MTRPGIEPGPLANTLTIMPMSGILNCNQAKIANHCEIFIRVIFLKYSLRVV